MRVGERWIIHEDPGSGFCILGHDHTEAKTSADKPGKVDKVKRLK